MSRRPGRREQAPEMQVVETPDVGGVEEVVLNRRGMPARERKKNRFYYDDDMITSDTQLRQTKQKNKSPGSGSRKVKEEPVEPPQYEEVVGAQEEVSDYQFGDTIIENEVALGQDIEIESSVSPERRKRDRILMPPPASPRNKAHQKSKSPSHSHMKQPSARQVAQAISSITNKKRSNRQSMEDEFGPYDNVPIKHDPDSPSKRAAKSLQQILPKPTKVRSSEKRTKSSSPDRPRMGVQRNTHTFSDEFDQAPFAGFEEVVNEVEINQFGAPYEVEVEFKKSKPPKEPRRTKYKEKDPLRVMKARRLSAGAPNSAELGGGKFLGSPALGGHGAVLDKKTAHNISIRLRNLLKLPKAHKWVCYEWFYSNIDKVLFDGENDFQICLKESFPDLKQTQLSHEEWTTIRRMMGKPRRCSQAFFDEEREELQRRRHKIRMIQQRKITDFNYKELPDEIPLQLVIGTKVTGRLRKPQDGLFTGTIEAVDTSNNTYRITFDRPGLGTHSIPDYEVLSNDPVETVSTSSFALKIPRRSYGAVAGTQFKISSALADEMSGFPKSPFPADGMLGGFPIRLLDMIVRLSKLLKAKREKILLLKELNVEAEKVTSYGRALNEDYRIRYSRCVLDLDSMNKEMSLYLEAIQQYCLDIAPDHGANQMIIPEMVQEQCRQEAALIVDTYNSKQNRQIITSPRILTLIANLTSLTLQAKALSNGERNLYEVKSIKDTLKDIKASLDGKNVQLFQDKVELPMKRIQAGLTMTYRSTI